MEKFSGIFGIILLIFLENLVIFCWGGGAKGNLRKYWKFLELLKTIFWGNLGSTSCLLQKKFQKTSIFWKKFEDGSRIMKRIL